MKRYCVIGLTENHWELAVSDRNCDDIEIIYTADRESLCYDYLRENVKPETPREQDEIEFMLDEYNLVKRLSKKNREKILYCHHAEHLKGKIIIRLRDAWQWGEEAQDYLHRYNKKAVVVKTIRELMQIMKYAERV